LRDRLAWGALALTALFAIAPGALAAVPVVSAKSAIMIDGVTGQILFAKNIHDRRPQASTTKMMSALVAIERGKLSDTVVASTASSLVNGSSIYLVPGERLTLEQLLYGMMLNSGNDATTAVAEHIAGDLDHFVALMNQKAHELGLQDTHYVNPHGLPVPGHYSSAYDLAAIARYALANPRFAEIAATKTRELPGNQRIKRRLLVNHNKLLRYFPGAWGGKTGYTTVAGKCFVGSARRDGRFVIEALMDDPNCWADAEQLLNYGLDDFQSVPVAQAGATVAQVPVRGGQRPAVGAVLGAPVSLSVPKGGDRPAVKTAFQVTTGLRAPVAAGQVVGHYQVFSGPTLLADMPLVAAEAVPTMGPVWGALSGVLGWFLKGGTLAVALYGLGQWWQARRARGRRRAKKLSGPALRS